MAESQTHGAPEPARNPARSKNDIGAIARLSVEVPPSPQKNVAHCAQLSNCYGVHNVFSFYDPADPHPLTRLWIKSWSARGWVPRLILPSETETGLTLRQVANRRGGGILTTPAEINFSRTPRTQFSIKRQHGERGWEAAATVVFSRGPLGMERTEDEVLHCGRPLACQ